MEKEWFKHEYHTRNKTKLATLLYDEKSRGYGLFWIIVEMLYENREKALEIDEVTYISISQQSGEPVEYVQEFIQKCLNRWKVFKLVRKKFFTTEKVEQNAKERREISEQRSRAGRKSAESRRKSSTRVEQTLTPVQHVLPVVEQNATEKRREEERREEESRVEEKREEKKKERRNSIVGTSADESATDRELRKKYLELTKFFPGWERKDIWNSIKQFIDEHKPKFFEPYLDAWNIFAMNFNIIRQPQHLTEKRIKKFNVRIKEPAFDFFKILEAIKQSSFLRGENNNLWHVGIEFILESEENYTKILEGKYK